MRERALPSWVVSVIVHAGLIVLLGMLLTVAPKGVVEEPGRTVGIVLQEVSSDGERFEGEDDQGDDDVEGERVETDTLLEALPAEETAASAAAMALPDLPALGPGGLETGGVGDAGDMTRGGGGRPGGLSGGKARVSVFGAEGVGTKFVYVFDRSASMEGARLSAAKNELVKSLESLANTHQFHILFFNDQIHVWDLTGGRERIAFGTEPNKERAARWVSGVTADGGTDRVTALKRAFNFQPDVVFFLTDDDTPLSASELAALRRANRVGAAVTAIEFGAGPPHGRRNFLVELAEQTGGQYAYVNTRRFER